MKKIMLSMTLLSILMLVSVIRAGDIASAQVKLDSSVKASIEVSSQMTVTEPKKDTVWYTGNKYTATWNTEGTNSINSTTITLTNTSYPLKIQNVLLTGISTKGSALLILPTDLPDSAYYQLYILICSKDNTTDCKATTSDYFTIKNTSGDTDKVKIMPSVASKIAIEKLESKNDVEVVLKEVGTTNKPKLVYQAKTETEGKLFGLFSIKVKKNVEVDSQDGSTKLTKPWWSFLVKYQTKLEVK